MRTLKISISLFLIFISSAKAQLDEAFPKQSVNYKIVDDNPKDLNYLWLHVQPLTIDVMQVNTAIGSGLECTYLPGNQWEIKGGIRGNLINAFDFQRTAAENSAFITTQDSKREQSQMSLTNSFGRFYSGEIGVMYAFKDELHDGASKIVLGDNAVPGNTGFPEIIEVNAKSRRILGARLGLTAMGSTVSLQKSIDAQNVVLTGSQGTEVSKTGTKSTSGFNTPGNDNEIFTNLNSMGFYAGGALQLIKNISVKTDRQGIVSNNSILTFYADLMINPWNSLEDVKATWAGKAQTETFDTSPIKLNMIGGRVGAEVRYNQFSFVSLGAEVGYRPGIMGEGFYGQIKLSIPTFSFGSTTRKVATNVGQNQSLTQ